jgi:hypothetical protein
MGNYFGALKIRVDYAELTTALYIAACFLSDDLAE